MEALGPLVPIFLTYVLSFVFLGIYWNNHHHMLHAADRINGKVLWANLHLLFWLSLIPFVTGWMGQNHFAPIPSAAYGIVLMCAGIAYYILAHPLVAEQGPDSRLARAMGRDRKGKLSIVLYAVGIGLCVRQSVDGGCGLRGGRADVARAGQANRDSTHAPGRPCRARSDPCAARSS